MTNRFTAFFLPLTALLILGGCAAMSDQPLVPETPESAMVFPLPPDTARFYFERTIYGSADVRVDTSADIFRRAFTGEQIAGEGFAKPYGLAVHQGRVFVSDTGRQAVLAFDIPEQKFLTIGEGDLAMPLGLDVDRLGNLYVTDGRHKRVLVYDRDGKFLRFIGDPTIFNRMAGIAVDTEGKRVYVVDIGGVQSQEHRVLVFDAMSGVHLFNIGTRGTETGQFNLPRDAAIAPDGSLFVVDGGNFRVQKFSPDGQFISTFGTIGRQSGQFSRPKELAIDSNGNIYVVDAAFGNFQIFNPEEKLLLSIGGRSNNDAQAKYSLPSGIAVDSDGRVYMVDQYFRKVDVYRPADLQPNEGFYLGKIAAEKQAAAAGQKSKK